MKIAIIAHDAKKELMVQFCSAYCGILSKHSLIATNTTGKQVSEATGLPIKRYLSGRGGAEQILALLSCNEVDVLLFFRDPINPKANDPNDMDLLTSSVDFVSDLKEDLKRRDFTVNAMAYNKKSGLIDLYGGLSDLKNGVIRAVGNAEERFEEDALRILRGVRFVSKLGFDLEDCTRIAMEKKAHLLKKISSERVFSELDKLLLGDNVKKALTVCPSVIFSVIPELEKCYGFSQYSKWHLYDVYTHTVTAVESIEKKSELRWCMLLHDVSKPEKFFLDDKGEGHFYGHADLSEKIANAILKRLKAPAKFIQTVCFLVKNHDRPLPINAVKFKLRLSEIGEDLARDLVKVKYADNFGQGTQKALEERKNIEELESKIDAVFKSGECIFLKDLAVNGNDVLSLGYKGKEVGEILKGLLVDVISGNIPNQRERLLKSIQKRKKV